MRSIAPRTRECLCAIVASAGNHFQPIEGLKPLAATPTYAGHLLDRAYWRRQPPRDGGHAAFKQLQRID